MFASVKSIALNGVDTFGVDVEISVTARGLPGFDIVGLPAKSVDESRLRVKMGMLNSSLSFPNKRITVNLAPADIHKDGSFYDLPIALGILSSEYGFDLSEDALFYGEVSLDGSLRYTRGVFLLALFAREHGYSKIFVPACCAEEAGCVGGVDVYGVICLREIVSHFSGESILKPYRGDSLSTNPSTADHNILSTHIIGQYLAKRAIEICAAGGHNLIMVGPPGAGKTLLANRLSQLLPPLTEAESIDVTRIYSSVGLIPSGKGLITKRPFRSPHHTISSAGLLGGGSTPTPGELSFAHCGVLFLDEFTEFPRFLLESLRQPLEDGSITITRRRGTAVFPARFTLVAASNPCPCGSSTDCRCTPGAIERYRQKLSGPIMDRIDLHVPVVAVDPAHLVVPGEDIVGMQDVEQQLRIIRRTRDLQGLRYASCGILVNSSMRQVHIRDFCHLSSRAKALLNTVSARYKLSVRSYFKLLKVARTIADLEHIREGGKPAAVSNNIRRNHILEASHFRSQFHIS